MTFTLTLASASAIRRQLLENAGLSVDVELASVDESALRYSLLAEDCSPREIAEALAELKAMRISQRRPDRFVL
jgi:septum formation protein